MHTTLDTVKQKTLELCQTILEQPEFQSIRKNMAAFMENEEVQMQYEQLSEKSYTLQRKQQQGVSLSDKEIADFEQSRDGFLNNPVGRNFLDAQQAMHKVQDMVNKYVSKTFELGRIPQEEDLQSGCCGGGGSSCGCH